MLKTALLTILEVVNDSIRKNEVAPVLTRNGTDPIDITQLRHYRKFLEQLEDDI